MSSQGTVGDASSRTAIAADSSEFIYRPISTMAVICLLLSIASLTSFLNYYWIVPAAIVLVVSIVTSILLDQSRAEYSGQFLAKLAIFLALVATIGAGTSHWIRYVAVTHGARKFADDYLRALLADNLDGAFAMRQDPATRTACDNDVKEMIFRMNKVYENFKEERATRLLRAGDSSTEKAKVEFLGTLAYAKDQGLDLVALGYRVTLANKAKTVYDVNLGVQGGVVPQGWKGRQWYIKYNEGVTEHAKPAEVTMPDESKKPGG